MTIQEQYFDILLALQSLPPHELQSPLLRFLLTCSKHLPDTNSQLFQDVFVMFCTKGMRQGYFVEFGATNGIDLSNTYLLEKHLGWTGILAEPAKRWHSALQANRTSHIDLRCVWETSGAQLPFIETEIGELSTLSAFSECDSHADSRKTGLKYNVETVSLNDLLEHYQSPTTIDYMSIDTEGSEFAILSAFDFQKYTVKILTLEHSYTEKRQDLRNLMESKGYINIFTEVSKWDDWYVHKSMFSGG